MTVLNRSNINFFVTTLTLFLLLPGDDLVAKESDDETLARVMSMSANSVSSTRGEEGVKLFSRSKEVEQTAYKYGVQLGLSVRYESIVEDVLDENAPLFETIANFNRFVFDGRILLPSVSIVYDDTTYSDDEHNWVPVSYTITQEPSLVKRAPNYRDYLERVFDRPEDPSMLPKTKAEKAIWKDALMSGFLEGKMQAEEMFRDDLQRLKKDHIERNNFLNLLSQNMVSEPRLESSKKGITFNGRTMNIGEVVYTIDSSPSYQPQSEWMSVWADE